MRLRATLTDLAAGQTYWILELVTARPEEGAALTEALEALVRELSAEAPAPPPAT